MATFSITGLDVHSSATGQITSAKAATLQIVSALGDATLDYSYVADHQGSAEVTLSNYNLLLNSMHLNDGPLPDRIEMFKMRWDHDSAAKTTDMLNLAFDGIDGCRDYLFVIGGAVLPNFGSTSGLATFLEHAQFSRLMDGNAQLRLDQIPDVTIAGVVKQLFPEGGTEEEDLFRFFQPSDAEHFDAFEFDATLSDETNDFDEVESTPKMDPNLLEPAIADPDFGDMAG